MAKKFKLRIFHEVPEVFNGIAVRAPQKRQLEEGGPFDFHFFDARHDETASLFKKSEESVFIRSPLTDGSPFRRKRETLSFSSSVSAMWMRDLLAGPCSDGTGFSYWQQFKTGLNSVRSSALLFKAPEPCDRFCHHLQELTLEHFVIPEDPLLGEKVLNFETDAAIVKG